ncbi:D-glycero-alpha-D-manno-heptose-1,7-bisphosphate 7-phosphatase [Paenibacillus xanthanilyticus]|uniref:D,D-heptose 1,7-bisphosphate phosphatase n=1 Tax=Paenibacillus xanthanilyticus TaxID=1783531 RepID=A0ABV8K8V6_9BACL
MSGVSAARESAVFLDRDGVINENIAGGYVTAWNQFQWLPGAIAAITLLNRRGWKVFVVTNQACIARDIASQAAIDGIHDRMLRELRVQAACVSGVYVCPHAPENGCACRKPRPGMLLQAAKEHGIDLQASYFVGDALTDMLAAQAANVQGILVRSGLGRSQEEEARRLQAASYYCETVLEAVEYITRTRTNA